MRQRDDPALSVLRFLLCAVAAGMILACLAGCATGNVQPALRLTASGVPVAGIQIGAQDENFLQAHWGKLLSGAAAGGGLVATARANHWFGWGKHPAEAGPTAAEGGRTTATVITVNGNDNRVNVWQGNDQGNEGNP